ncbi:MAG TPA: hypothetical protein QF630_11775 [Alphaproteobacteria bacterium]|nr:hypothetical protein [Alphaproteobacteria bacterium]
MAYALSLHRDAARGMIANGHLTHWLERSLGEIRMADAVTAMVGDEYDDDNMLSNIDDKVLSRLSRLLDPEGPVYAHGKAIMLDGFEYAVAEAILSGDAESERAIESMLTHALPVDQLPAQWSNARR